MFFQSLHIEAKNIEPVFQNINNLDISKHRFLKCKYGIFRSQVDGIFRSQVDGIFRSQVDGNLRSQVDESFSCQLESEKSRNQIENYSFLASFFMHFIACVLKISV